MATPIKLSLPKIDISKWFSIDLINATIPNNEGTVEIPTIFTFEFSEDIGLATAGINVVFDIYEGKVIKESRTIKKALIPVTGNPKQATAVLTFPEALAGAKLRIYYRFDSIFIKFNSIIFSDIEIKRAGNAPAEIEKVYWAEQEHAKWGAKLTEKKEICKNEIGFLHIYTKGMFGHEVWIEIKGKAGSTERLRKGKKTMQDNVLSIPYTMSDMIAAYKSVVPTFNGDTLILTGDASVNSNMTSKTSSSDLTLHCKVDEANPSLSATGTDVKVKITTDEEIIPEPTKAQCILEFRPDNTYIGDFGFDWVRRGDTGAPGIHNDYDFKSHMGKHYNTATMKVENDGNEHGDAFKKDEDPNTTVLDYDTGIVDHTFGDGRMYTNLTLRYRRLIFNWDPKIATGNSSETYTPIMTIMDGKVANLVLHFDIKEEPKEVVFEFNNSSASTFLCLDKTKITSNLPATMTGTAASVTDKTSHTLKITCNGEFDQEYTLFARAFKKDDPVTSTVDTKGEICGMLRILPNAPMYQHKIKIVLFKIKTNINGSDKEGKTDLVKDRLNEILGQALTKAEIDIVDINTRTDTNFRTDYCKLVGTTYVIDGDTTRSWNMRTYLENKRDKKYDHYYKIYCFDEGEETSNGYSWGYKYTVVFNTANTETGIHELLHSLELAHPFDAYSHNTPFSYEFIKTDNIMDYGHWVAGLTRKSLFHWHWQIINTKIR